MDSKGAQEDLVYAIDHIIWLLQSEGQGRINDKNSTESLPTKIDLLIVKRVFCPCPFYLIGKMLIQDSTSTHSTSSLVKALSVIDHALQLLKSRQQTLIVIHLRCWFHGKIQILVHERFSMHWSEHCELWVRVHSFWWDGSLCYDTWSPRREHILKAMTMGRVLLMLGMVNAHDALFTKNWSMDTVCSESATILDHVSW